MNVVRALCFKWSATVAFYGIRLKADQYAKRQLLTPDSIKMTTRLRKFQKSFS